jgi:DNA-binding transcriptional LysR family regulator
LEYVLAVARELHFRRAAERVHVVQSSLSRQVREFEAELGFEIFYRNNHLVDLTDAGRAFTLALERNPRQQIPLRTEPLHAVSVRGHSSNGSGAIRLAELRTHPLIVPRSQRAHPALYQWLHGQCVIAGFRPNIVEEASSTQEVFDLVQDGVGTAIVPAGICDEPPPALQCSPIHGMEALPLVFIYRYGSSQTAQRIVSEIANSLRHAYLAKAG